VPGGTAAETERKRRHSRLMSEHAQYRAFLISELNRVDAAMGVLEGERTARPRNGAKSTWTLMRRMIAQMPAGYWFHIDQAYEWMTASGWETTAVKPRQTMATSLAQMANQKELFRCGRPRGWYCTDPGMPPGARPPAEALGAREAGACLPG
jgi:hypothetical protein